MQIFASESDTFLLSPRSNSTGDLASIQEEEEQPLAMSAIPPVSPGTVCTLFICIYTNNFSLVNFMCMSCLYSAYLII